MKKNKLIYGISILSILLLSGCAKRPNEISASNISSANYSAYTCDSLSEKKDIKEKELKKLSDMQNSKANYDALLLVLSVFPVSKLTGDYEADISKIKGELKAIETTQKNNSCI